MKDRDTEMIELRLDDSTIDFLSNVAGMAEVTIDTVVSVMLAAYLKRMDAKPDHEAPTADEMAVEAIREQDEAQSRAMEAQRGAERDAVWQTEFAEACDLFEPGQRVRTSWGIGVVERVDRDWQYGGVWVRHNIGPEKFSPHNVTPEPEPEAEPRTFTADQIRTAAHAEFLDMREDNVSPMKFMRAVLKRLTGVDEK